MAAPLARGLETAEINGQVPEAMRGWRRQRIGCAPQNRIDARNELPGTERLGDVVIRAQLQAEYLSISCPLAVKRMIGVQDASHAQRPAYAETILARQHDVEQDQVVPALSCSGLSLAAVTDDIDDVAFGSQQVVLQGRGDGGLVLNDQNVVPSTESREPGVMRHLCQG